MIGIMSDSHDNIYAIRKAIKIFNNNDLDIVIHAGDLISPFTALEFRKLEPELVAIYGNNDGNKEAFKTAYKEICVLEDFKEISVEGWKFSIIHGTNEAIVESLAKLGNMILLLRSHS